MYSIRFLTIGKFKFITLYIIFIYTIKQCVCMRLKIKYGKWKIHWRQNKNRVSGELYFFILTFMVDNIKWIRIFALENKRIELRFSEYKIAVNLHIQELANRMGAYEYFVTESLFGIACFNGIFPIYW